MSDDYEQRREQRREEERQYIADVWYDVWRSGGNPDRIDDDRVRDAYYDGQYHEDAASRELRLQSPKPQPEEEEMQQEEQRQMEEYQ